MFKLYIIDSISFAIISFSGGFGTGRTGGGQRPRQPGQHPIFSDHRHGVHHLHRVNCPCRSDHRLAGRFQVADQGETQQRAVATRSPAVHPGHHAKQRGRGQRHVRQQRPVGCR